MGVILHIDKTWCNWNVTRGKKRSQLVENKSYQSYNLLANRKDHVATLVVKYFLNKIRFDKGMKSHITKLKNFSCLIQLDIGWLWMYSMASLQESILSASKSGISSLNSSSRAITSSTLSKLSKPRSFWKCTSGVTCKTIERHVQL